MVSGENVVVGLFFIEFAGIDELCLVVCLVFGEDQDVDGNGGAIKEVGSEGDHGLHKVVVYQILPDFLLRTAPVEDTREADNGGTAFTGQVAQGVENKGEVGLGFRSQHAGRGKALIVDESGVVAPDPGHRVGRIGDNGVEGLFVTETGV